MRHEVYWWRSGPGAPAALPAEPASAADGTAPFRVLLAFTVVNLLAPQQFVPGLERLRPALLLALLALGAYVLDRLQHRLPLTLWTRETRLLTWLVAWSVLTLPLSTWPLGSLAFLLGSYLKVLLVFLLLANTVSDARRLRLVYWTFSLASIPIALTAIVHYATGQFIDSLETGSVQRIVGYSGPLTHNPNDTALTLNVILPLTLALLAAARSALTRALLGAAVALQIIGCLCTLSRGGFVTLIAIGGMFVWTRLGRRSAGARAVALVAAAIVLLVALPLLPSSIVDRVATITDLEGDSTGSARERVSDMVAATRYVATHPLFGAGLGMSTLALNEVRGAAWRLVHNVYLQIGVELGLPGLVLFVALLVSCLGAARRGAAGSRSLAPLAAGLRLSLVGFAVAGMFHPIAYNFYFYYLAALAIALRQMSVRVRARERDAAGAAVPRPVACGAPVVDPARVVRA